MNLSEGSLYRRKTNIMQVNIPKPCNENWTEMTTTQKGAFCQKCAIDVIDFSKKTPTEITETLKANIGKHMCGRFKKSQLETISDSYQIWNNQSIKTLQSKFLWACVMVFGLTLFTGCESSYAKENILGTPTAIKLLQIEDSINNAIDVNLDTTTKNLHIQEQYLGEVEMEKGEVDWEMGEPVWEEEILGEIEAVIPCNIPVPNDSIPAVVLPVESHILGMLVAPENFQEYIEQETPDNPEKKEPHIAKNDTDFNALVYPNPAKELARLSITPNERAYTSIELFNFNGKKLLTIFEGQLETKEEIFTLNLADYATGTYLIKIHSSEKITTLKLNKVAK